MSNTGRDQQVICVLGMHRSGTSLLTRILNLIGVDLGPVEVLTTEPVADNPKGYWEHSDLTLVSDAIIKRHGGSWDMPPRLPTGWETDAAVDDLKERAEQLIRDQFGDAPLWGWKDPRTCLTLPFWQRLIPDMRYIICLRSPVDVARSLERRDGMSPEKSAFLWLTYVSSALHYTEGKPRLVVFYDDLIDHCRRELQRLAEFLGKAERASQMEVFEAVQKFIEPGLQHHRESYEEIGAGSALELCARALYSAQRITQCFSRNTLGEHLAFDKQLYEALDELERYASRAADLQSQS